MSRDDGVYVLITKAAKEGELEYRVVHTQGIDKLWEHDMYSITELVESYDKPLLNKHWAMVLFGNGEVYTDMPTALLAAYDLYQHWGGFGQVEYGICPLDHSDVVFPGFVQAATNT